MKNPKIVLYFFIALAALFLLGVFKKKPASEAQANGSNESRTLEPQEMDTAQVVEAREAEIRRQEMETASGPYSPFAGMTMEGAERT